MYSEKGISIHKKAGEVIAIPPKVLQQIGLDYKNSHNKKYSCGR